MLLRFFAFFLIFLMAFGPALAQTEEAKVANFYQEADIIFWQTLPFATLIGHFIDRQLSAIMFPGAAAHWEVIIPFAVVVSAGNAFLHARRVTSEQNQLTK